ncbi:PTS sugar transporter subunit IIA [Utexia brackfieldae]|uniref:PTS sugar transporter subunit IIA n=1 Tax=Utexia brackfieldae TaxID=3074108 RepID=UPI00370D5DDD
MTIKFNLDLITLDAHYTSANEAIEAAGNLLLTNELCNQNYVHAMQNTYQQFGSYIVLDNGLAMPHARPEHGALTTGFCIIT